MASINAAYSVGASKSTSISRGQTITITVPPHKYGNGQYGAFRVNVTGKSSYRNPSCGVSFTKTNRILAPYRSRWKTWTSSS
ncbi:hypothetical protein [Arthrobacter sp.]|uniref:hypothetical protein n=1 Tax=Arthrobacter sp. TaxID=1667 RepID=UPI003A947751